MSWLWPARLTVTLTSSDWPEDIRLGIRASIDSVLAGVTEAVALGGGVVLTGVPTAVGTAGFVAGSDVGEAGLVGAAAVELDSGGAL